MMLMMLSFDSELNIMISSTRFRNSGENFLLSAFLTTDSLRSLVMTVLNPTPAPKSFSSREPMFEVMMIMVFLKSIFLPRLSVRHPSSST